MTFNPYKMETTRGADLDPFRGQLLYRGVPAPPYHVYLGPLTADNCLVVHANMTTNVLF